MAQLDDIVGAVMKKLDDEGLENDTILAFSTDNGTENFTWPDGGQTPFAGGKGTALEGGFRVPMIIRWPGKVPAGKVENGNCLGPRLVPHFLCRGRQCQHQRRVDQGQTAGRRELTKSIWMATTRLDLITGKGPVEAPRDLLFHRRHARAPCGSTITSIVLPISPTAGWAPLKRSTGRFWSICGSTRSNGRECPTARPARWPITTGSSTNSGALYSCSRKWPRPPQSFIEFPPMQKGASFNMENIKEQILKAIQANHSK